MVRTMNCRSIIEDIRAQYTGLKDMPRRSLASSIRALAEDLYSKDTHFVFELIQNAEDNEYLSGEPPSLCFRLTTLQIEHVTTQALVVLNNERGFSEAHVRALCQVGQTTKTKRQGYIGEKGIGFKSVFKVTACPYVFSNGFQFALPEDDPETGLGYIVPRWVDSPPPCATQARTCLVLPFNKPGHDPKQIVDAFRQIQPETLLFLRKLKSLEISIETADRPYSVTIEKDDCHAPLVNLTVCHEDRDKNGISSYPYWVVGNDLKRPEDIHADRRADVTTTTETVAIPLGPEEHSGSCFAYLPVWESTGLPFLINADFLLVSSREGIREAESWNQWLRDQVADIYAQAFLSAVSADRLSEEQRLRAYASLPTTSHHQFLQPVVENIYEHLKDTKCIITSRNNLLAHPKNCRIVPKTFRQLFEPTNAPPVPLPKGVSFIHVDIENSRAPLKKLGVGQLLQKDVLEALSCEQWLNGQTHAWFIDLYRALEGFEKGTLLDRPIIPATSVPHSQAVLTCDARQPVYFPVKEVPAELLRGVPPWLRNQIPLSFLQAALHKEIEKQKDANELLKWMTTALNVYDFSIQNYCVDIIRHLAATKSTLSGEQLIAATRFLAKHAAAETVWGDLPIVLSDGRIMELSTARKLQWRGTENVQAIVIPEENESVPGWRHVWSDPEDRRHFVALHSSYRGLTSKWFAAAGITPFPGFVATRYTPSTLNTPEAEARLLQECCRAAANSRYWETNVQSWSPPRVLLDETPIKKDTAQALLSFLCSLPRPQSTYSLDADLHAVGLRARGTYHNYGGRARYAPSTALLRLRSSRWLPSTKGLVRPDQAFLRKQGIHEVLGDTVAYLVGDVPEWLQGELGIKQEVSVTALLGILKSYRMQSAGDLRTTGRIYKALAAYAGASANDLKKEFDANDLVFTQDATCPSRWLKPGDCIWTDASQIFGPSFGYLEKCYPGLRDFFVTTVGVKDDVDAECYARRWLDLQKSHSNGDKSVRPVLERLYRAILAEVRSKEHAPWWPHFREEAKLYTQQDSFESPDDVVVPDDGKLRSLFPDTVAFAWRPQNDSFEDWSDLYNELGARRLTESVNVVVADRVPTTVLETNRVLTPAATRMIASWLRAKRQPLYETKLGDGTIRDLTQTREASTPSDLKLRLVLSTRSVTREVSVTAPVHWDRARKQLIIADPDSASRRVIAESLARGLSDARTFHDLADWVELVLGERDTSRLTDRGWSVPRELHSDRDGDEGEDRHAQTAAPPPTSRSDIPSTNAYNNSPEPAQTAAQTPTRTTGTDRCKPPRQNPSTAKTSAPVDSGETIAEEQPEPPPQPDTADETEDLPSRYEELLRRAFSRPGETEIDPSCMSAGAHESQGLPNPERRRQRVGELQRTRIAEEPSAEDRRRTTEHTLLEPADPLVRIHLEEWYHGRCQVCAEGTPPWPEHNGHPFFVAARLVERCNARWLDDVANAVCLCANHFAQWRHAAKDGPPDIIQTVLRLDPEASPDMLHIPIILAGQRRVIRYNPKHILALQELIRASQQGSSALLP